jgi:hypothetical protein
MGGSSEGIADLNKSRKKAQFARSKFERHHPRIKRDWGLVCLALGDSGENLKSKSISNCGMEKAGLK